MQKVERINSIYSSCFFDIKHIDSDLYGLLNIPKCWNLQDMIVENHRYSIQYIYIRTLN